VVEQTAEGLDAALNVADCVGAHENWNVKASARSRKRQDGYKNIVGHAASVGAYFMGSGFNHAA
jgi:hypothetical protein